MLTAKITQVNELTDYKEVNKCLKEGNWILLSIFDKKEKCVYVLGKI